MIHMYVDIYIYIVMYIYIIYIYYILLIQQKLGLHSLWVDTLDPGRLKVSGVRSTEGICPRGGGNWGTLRIPRED